MDGRFSNPFLSEQEDARNMPERVTELPFSAMFNDGKISATSSTKKSRRAVQKRVVSVPIGDVDGSRLKGETAPPSDSWAWRKYGQKPIKGSPYPRGYYRCSSSKGCPARKQVERSRVDPTMLVITYACEHNHPWPASRNSNSNPSSATGATTFANSSDAAGATTTNSGGSSPASATTETTSISTPKFPPEEPTVFTGQPEIEPDENNFGDLGEEPMMSSDDFSWFPHVTSYSPTVLESSICAGSNNGDADMAMILQMREEDESLFSDLGELPECSSFVFRRGVFEQDEEKCSLRAAPVWGSTG